METFGKMNKTFGAYLQQIEENKNILMYKSPDSKNCTMCPKMTYGWAVLTKEEHPEPKCSMIVVRLIFEEACLRACTFLP